MTTQTANERRISAYRAAMDAFASAKTAYLKAADANGYADAEAAYSQASYDARFAAAAAARAADAVKEAYAGEVK